MWLTPVIKHHTSDASGTAHFSREARSKDSQRFAIPFLFNKFDRPVIDGGQSYAPTTGALTFTAWSDTAQETVS